MTDINRAAYDEMLRRREARKVTAIAVKATGKRASEALDRIAELLAEGGTAIADRAWRTWLDDPHPRLGEVLLASGRPAATEPQRGLSLVALPADDPSRVPRGALIEALLMSGHPLAAIAQAKLDAGGPGLIEEICAAATRFPGLDWYCVHHGLEPADPRRRAVFLMVTRQFDRYRDTDPDGTLLALAYRDGDFHVRAAIRAALSASGLRGWDAARLDRLRDPAERWRLIAGLPLADAVAAVPSRRVRKPVVDGARDDGGLYKVLASADPAAVADARRTLEAGAVTQVTLQHGVADVEFAHGSAALLTVSAPSPAGRKKPARVEWAAVELPGGRVIGSPGSRRMWRAGCVLNLGDVVLAADQEYGQARIVRWSPLLPGETTTHRMASYDDPDPIVFDDLGDACWAPWDDDCHGRVVSMAWDPPGVLAATATGNLLRLDETGAVARSWPPATYFPGVPFVLARDPVTGRLAAAGTRVVVLDRPADDSLPPPPAAMSEPVHERCVQVRFTAADRLVTMDVTGRMRAWRVTGDVVAPVAEAAVAADPGHLAVLPEHGLVAVIDTVTRSVRFLDAGTLAASPPPVPIDVAAAGLSASPDGRFLAVRAEDGTVDVLDMRLAPVLALLDAPLAVARPADLDTVARARRHVTDPGVLVLLDLAEAAVRQRLGEPDAPADPGPEVVVPSRDGMPAIAALLARDDPAVLNAAWTRWLDDGDPDLQAVLLDAGRPATEEPQRSMSLVALPGDASDVPGSVLLAAADRDDHPIAAMALEKIPGRPDLADEVCHAAHHSTELEEFCVRHGLEPADTARRAAFLLITRQYDRYRGLDPDGSLLALAARGGTWWESFRIGDELRYVDGELDPPFPVLGHRLQELIVRPRGLAAGLAALTAKAITRVPCPGRVTDVSIAPDGAAVTVLQRDDARQGVLRLDTFEIPGGRLLEHLEAAYGNPWGPAVNTGDAVLIGCGGLALVRRGTRSVQFPFHPGTGHGRHGPIVAMVRHPPGVAASTSTGHLLHFDDEGAHQATWNPDRLGLGTRHPSGWDGAEGGPFAIAHDPETGRLAAAGDRIVIVAPDHRPGQNQPWIIKLDGGGSLLPILGASERLPQRCTKVAFTAPDALVTCDASGRVRSWRLDGDRIVPQAEAPLTADPDHLAVLPDSGIVVVIQTGRGARFLDAATLRRAVPPVREFDHHAIDFRAIGVWSDGPYLAVLTEVPRGDRAVLNVLDMRVAPVLSLLGEVPEAIRPDDLDLIARARPHLTDASLPDALEDTVRQRLAGA